MKKIVKLSVVLLSVSLFVLNFYGISSKHENNEQLYFFVQSANADSEGDCASLTPSICHNYPGKHCIGNDGGVPFDCVDEYSA